MVHSEVTFWSKKKLDSEKPENGTLAVERNQKGGDEISLDRDNRDNRAGEKDNQDGEIAGVFEEDEE